MVQRINGNTCIREVKPQGEITAYYLYCGNSRNPIASVVVSVEKDYVEVLHIFVEKKFRRRGYGRKLVQLLKNRYDYIITGWLSSENLGRSLFLDMDFEVKKSLRNNVPDTLEWIKGE